MTAGGSLLMETAACLFKNKIKEKEAGNV